MLYNRMRLRRVVTVDGRKNVITTFREFMHEESDLVNTFRREDCVLFINHTRTFLRFVSGFERAVTPERVGADSIHRPEDIFSVLVSVELRLDTGVWSPLRLTDFARQAGIELMNLKSFAEHYEEEQERKRQERRERE